MLIGGQFSARTESKSGTGGDAEAAAGATANTSPIELVSVVTSPEIAISEEKLEQTETEDKVLDYLLQ